MNINSGTEATPKRVQHYITPSQITSVTSTRPTQFKHSRIGSLLPLQSSHPYELRSGSSKKTYENQISPNFSILLVKKETLRHKRTETKKPGERTHLVRKDKTDCINLAYIQMLISRRRAIDWIRYNISEGIYHLWHRTKDQLEYFRNLGTFQTLYKQIHHLCQQVTSLMQQCELQMIPTAAEGTSPKVRQFKSRKLGNQEVRLSNLGSKDVGGQPQHRSMGVSVHGQGVVDKKQTTLSHLTYSKLQTSVNSLGSVLCLIRRSIALDKQNKMVRQFLDHRKSNGLKLSPQEHQELASIISINERRCQIIGELVEKFAYLQNNHHNIALTPEQIKRINAIGLAQQLRTANKNDNQIETVSKQMVVINGLFDQFQVEIAKDQMGAKINPNNPSLIKHNEFAGKTNDCSKENSQTDTIVNEGRISQNRDSALLVKTNKQSKNKIKINTVVKTGKTKKNIGFAECIKDEEYTAERKYDRKTTSMNACKSTKAISWEEFELESRSSNRLVSMRSMKSTRSLKSYKKIGSSKSIGFVASGRRLRSLKTQRELRYLLSNKRQVSCIRNYRDQMFKAKPEPQLKQVHVQGSMKLATPQQPIFEDQNEELPQQYTKITSLDQLIMGEDYNQHEIVQHQTEVQVIQEMRRAEFPKSRMNHMKPCRKSEEVQILPVPVEDKANLMREFLACLKQAEAEPNINKKKKIIQNQLERLYTNKIVSQAQYEKFKAYFTVGEQAVGRVSRDYGDLAENIEDSKQKRLNAYMKLLQIRKVIELNTQLSQTNRYYYNFHRFKGQQAEITKTKRCSTNEEDLFNMRMQVSTPARVQKQRPQFAQSQKQTSEANVLKQISL